MDSTKSTRPCQTWWRRGWWCHLRSSRENRARHQTT